VNTFRIKASNIVSVLAIFPGAIIVPAPGPWLHGCSDPDCCIQHPGVASDGSPMVGIKVPVTGGAFHRALVGAGIVR